MARLRTGGRFCVVVGESVRRVIAVFKGDVPHFSALGALVVVPCPGHAGSRRRKMRIVNDLHRKIVNMHRLHTHIILPSQRRIIVPVDHTYRPYVFKIKGLIIRLLFHLRNGKTGSLPVNIAKVLPLSLATNALLSSPKPVCCASGEVHAVFNSAAVILSDHTADVIRGSLYRAGGVASCNA